MFFIILLMIILNIIYNISGIYFVISFIVWIINLGISTLLLIKNGENFWIRLVQLISIFITIYKIFINIKILLFKLFI
jgi:hypothetical protein